MRLELVLNSSNECSSFFRIMMKSVKVMRTPLMKKTVIRQDFRIPQEVVVMMRMQRWWRRMHLVLPTFITQVIFNFWERYDCKVGIFKAIFSDHAAFHLPTNLEIREGIDYQCPVQDWTTEGDYYDDAERETCLWRPTNLLEVADINDYLSIALSSFNIEQDRVYFFRQFL